jgi:hypothetical protein
MNRKPIYYRTHSAIMVFESAQVLAEEMRQRADDSKACIVKAAHNARVAEDSDTMAAITKRIGAYLRPIG